MAGTARGGYWYAAAIRASDLPPSARLVALVIVGQADNDTGKLRRSLGQLASDSGLDRRTVARQLALLESAGFLRRKAPKSRQALGQREMTTYTTVIPAEFPSGTTPLALVAPVPVPSGTTPHSPYRTTGGGASAGAPAPAPRTTRDSPPDLDDIGRPPHSHGDICGCPVPGRTADADSNECFRCYGEIPA